MTDKPETWVDIQVTNEGISATLYMSQWVGGECPNCLGEGCNACEDTGTMVVDDPIVLDEWWVPWADVIADKESWSAFQDVTIEHTTAELDTQ